MCRARERPRPATLARLCSEPVEPPCEIRRPPRVKVCLDRVREVVVEEKRSDSRKYLRLVAFHRLCVLHAAEREEPECARADVARPGHARVGSRGILLRACLLVQSLGGRKLGEDPDVGVDLRPQPADLCRDPKALRDPDSRLGPAPCEIVSGAEEPTCEHERDLVTRHELGRERCNAVVQGLVFTEQYQRAACVDAAVPLHPVLGMLVTPFSRLQKPERMLANWSGFPWLPGRY